MVQRQLRLFFAPSSSAPLVYWLGCLCSLVELVVLVVLVVRLDEERVQLVVLLELWLLVLLLVRFSIIRCSFRFAVGMPEPVRRGVLTVDSLAPGGGVMHEGRKDKNAKRRAVGHVDRIL